MQRNSLGSYVSRDTRMGLHELLALYLSRHIKFLLLALQDLTNRARDSLVSFGERLSTRIFAAFLRHQVSTACYAGKS